MRSELRGRDKGSRCRRWSEDEVILGRRMDTGAVGGSERRVRRQRRNLTSLDRNFGSGTSARRVSRSSQSRARVPQRLPYLFRIHSPHFLPLPSAFVVLPPHLPPTRPRLQTWLSRKNPVKKVLAGPTSPLVRTLDLPREYTLLMPSR